MQIKLRHMCVAKQRSRTMGGVCSNSTLHQLVSKSSRCFHHTTTASLISVHILQLIAIFL